MSSKAFARYSRVPASEEGTRGLQATDGRYLKEMQEHSPPVLSIYPFANLWGWTRAYDFRLSRFGDALLIRAANAPPSVYHTYLEPIGVPPAERARIIQEFLEKNPRGEDGKPNVFRHVSKEVADLLAGQKALGVQSVDGKAEFVYKSRSLATLGHPKLKDRRNQTRGFFKEYPDKGESPRSEFIAIQDLSPAARDALIPKLEAFLDHWASESRGNDRRDFKEEVLGTRRMLRDFTRLHLKGGALLVDGKVVAFTLGKQINPTTMVVYSEKAVREIDGKKTTAYQAINQRFALSMVKESLRANGSEAAQSALLALTRWERTENLGNVRTGEISDRLEGIMGVGAPEIKIGDALAEWKANFSANPVAALQSGLQPRANLIWEVLRTHDLRQALNQFKKSDEWRSNLPLRELKSPQAKNLLREIDAMRDHLLTQANLALKKPEIGPFIQEINRQEHGDDGGHQNAKDRYAPKRMELNYAVSHVSVGPITFDVAHDEE